MRVIDSNGVQLGVLPIAKALEAAYAQDLDLVNVSPNSDPPVCKIIDYGKYRFEQMKREKEAKKNQKVIDIKEIRIIGLGIDSHDLETKVNHAKRFLKDGDKVKVSVRLRGRELGRTDSGIELMKNFAEHCADYCTIEKAAKILLDPESDEDDKRWARKELRKTLDELLGKKAEWYMDYLMKMEKMTSNKSLLG